jgi:hypothetical protein
MIRHVEDGQAVAHRERLLVVGHIHERDADLALDRAELLLHLLAQLQVERAERLVQQQDARAVHERAGKGHALPLPARELAWPPPLVAAETYQLERLGGPSAPLFLAGLRDPQAVLDVLAHAHVRKERVVLEHGVHVALVGREVGYVAPRQLYPSFIGPLEARDHAQAGRLARARRAQQREELVFSNFQVDPVDRHEVAERLASPVEAHGNLPIPGHPGLLYTLEHPWCE